MRLFTIVSMRSEEESLFRARNDKIRDIRSHVPKQTNIRAPDHRMTNYMRLESVVVYISILY
jgi:hypothetical protein